MGGSIKTVRVHFTNRDAAAFVADLRSAVTTWFAEAGRSDKANAAMVAKTVLFLGTIGVAYGMALSNLLPGWGLLGVAILMGVTMAGIGFSVSHDALHGAYSSRGWVNRMLGASFDALGANGYMWQITHNVIHHTYTNIHGVDEDLSVSPLLRLSPEAPWKPFHRYQHWYACAAYSLSTLFWVFVKDFKYFLQRDLGPLRDRKHSPSEIAWLIGSKAIYFSYALVIPLLVIDRPWWQVIAGFVLVHLVAGVILGVVFQLAHVVEGTEHPVPAISGEMEHAWTIHEMLTTSNFANGNPFISWYVGGLNYQIEHHLFPRVCSVHYPALSGVVRTVAQRHGVPYNEHRTLIGAVSSHHRMLKLLGSAGPTPV
ncbi:MAG: linoleoyl-CoA desaturase [Gemmatimonadales bacterium]|jgi:linoleoyl-CoA desaturase|nr:linoleoyl-CoA desaturase [Gemmatimonadales bacterium]